MVSVVQLRPQGAAAPLDALAAGLTHDERAALARALEFAEPLYAGQSLSTGEPVWPHALGIAASLAAIGMDPAARAAGVLFAAPKYLGGTEKLAEAFGAEIAGLAAGVEKLYQLRVLTRANAAQQSEILRKMVLGMVEDVRVVLVRLASRTQTLRWYAKHDSEERRAYARETLDIYAPLANRLGVWQLKWELEDLSFRFLEPELYRKIAKMLDERRVEREQYIAEAMAALARELEAVGVKGEVHGRPKHIYSIWNKMRAKGLDFAQVYDVRALRVIVPSVKDCYAALGVVHNLWAPIAREFDDYISRPKGNLYQSLHTAVIGPGGKTLEVQIRTEDMHRHAELGVAAHWRYKEAGKATRAQTRTPSTTRSPGCGSCSRGATRWPRVPPGPSARSGRRWTTRSTSSRRRARWWISPRAPRRSTSPTRCIPTSATAAAAPRWTAIWCRSTRRSKAASAWSSPWRRRAALRATG